MYVEFPTATEHAGTFLWTRWQIAHFCLHHSYGYGEQYGPENQYRVHLDQNEAYTMLSLEWEKHESTQNFFIVT